MPTTYTDADLELKSEFIWLGYSLKLTDDGFLLLTQTKMNQRFETCRRLVQDPFQYIEDTSMHRKIFMIYVSPVIDWFLPVVMLEPVHELARANKCGKFQHDMLSMVFNVSRNCSAEKLFEIAAVKPISFKLRETAVRLSKFVARDHDDIFLGPQKTNPGGQMSLRSGKSKTVIAWFGAEKRDLGDRIYMLAHEYKNLPRETIEKYDPTSANALSFDVKKAQE